MNYGFQERLEFSLSNRREDVAQIIKAVLTGCASVVKSGAQDDRSGVDYWATLRQGARVAIDLKTRDKGCSLYWKNAAPELALETWSVVPSFHGRNVSRE